MGVPRDNTAADLVGRVMATIQEEQGELKGMVGELRVDTGP